MRHPKTQKGKRILKNREPKQVSHRLLPLQRLVCITCFSSQILISSVLCRLRLLRTPCWCTATKPANCSRCVLLTVGASIPCTTHADGPEWTAGCLHRPPQDPSCELLPTCLAVLFGPHTVLEAGPLPACAASSVPRHGINLASLTAASCSQGHCTKYTKRNLDIHPFEVGGETKLEHYAGKSDCGVVVYANHAKKRPHNLTLGRFYNGHVLDLLELGVEGFRSIQEFAASGASKVQSTNKVRKTLRVQDCADFQLAAACWQ